MLQTNVREGYRITTLEVIELIEDLISYLQNAQISKVFYKAAYSAKVKIEDLSNMLMLILSKTAQRRSLSVVSNRSTALITNKFGVASLTKLAILNNANVALVDAVHYSVQKLEENYFEVRAQHLKYNVIDALTITLIKDDDDLLGTVNSYIKPPLKRCKTEAADSRYAKASRGRTKKDKDLEDSNTSSDVLRLRRRDRAAACAQLAERKHLLDSDDYCLDSSSDINSKDDLEDEEATIAKDLAREQKERLKALLNAKTLHSRRLIDAYILYFKELLSNNGGIFANAIGMGKTQAIVLAVLIRHCDLSDLLALQFCFFSDSLPENIGRLTKEEVIEMRIDTTNAISKALAATNKLVALQSYVLGGSAALESYVTFNATNKRDSVTSDRIYKIEDAVYRLIAETLSYRTYFLSIVQNAEQQCRDILEKEGLNKSEASRRDYFLSIAAEDTAKAANILLPPKEVRAKILIESYKPIVQARDLDRPWIIVALIAFAEAITLTEATHVLAEMCVSIVYFNLDSELELKVLSKQDVKTTS
ncbi:hypothetical protein HBH92_161060 [Parastagonospora nodorum]|nr:hypothetical protein HBH92_161060 [Parastagonospora nodorum]KAH4880150.1 hypothetical protein HBH59_057310 [Parastagonospora nodorum]